jgi:arylsulfatase A-like enzyme
MQSLKHQRIDYRDQSVNILIIAAWFGILSGLVEGILFLILQLTGIIMFANEQIVWIASFFNLGLFLVIGIGLVLITGVFRNLPGVMIAIFTFVFLTIIDWIGLVFYDRFYKWALVIFAAGIAVVVVRSFNNNPSGWKGFFRRSLPLALGLSVLVFLGFQGGEWFQEQIAQSKIPPAAQGVPNVLLVVLDTVRSDHVSSNGYYRQTTPHLDQIANQGVSFENAYSTSSYSLPSHASLMTGKNVFEHGIEWETSKALAKKPYPTIAESMRNLGYRTGGFSANIFWVSREQGFNRGFLHYEDFYQTLEDMLSGPFFSRVYKKLFYSKLMGVDVPGRRYSPDINKSVLNWVKKDSKKPFFVFVNYMDAHDPYLPPEPYRSMFSNQENPGGILNTEFGRIDPKLSPDQAQAEMDAYDGAIAYVDQHLGELVTGLEQQSGGNLLVVITSDHGEAFGEHGTYLHSLSLYREEIGVPLVFYAPGKVPAGVRIDQPVSIISVPATILDIVGDSKSASKYGRSLVELLKNPGTAATWPEPLAELAQQDWKPDRSPVHKGWIKSLISPIWQYIEYENLEPELFGLKDDPYLINNLAKRDEFAVIIAGFKARLKNLLQS